MLLLLPLIGVLSAGPASAQVLECVPARDMSEAAATLKLVSPATAVTAVRRQVPNAEVVRATLCRTGEGPVYVIVALRRDGRMLRVEVDGPSGRVKSVR